MRGLRQRLLHASDKKSVHPARIRQAPGTHQTSTRHASDKKGLHEGVVVCRVVSSNVHEDVRKRKRNTDEGLTRWGLRRGVLKKKRDKMEGLTRWGLRRGVLKGNVFHAHIADIGQYHQIRGYRYHG
jgi:hypothetical protein